MNIGKRYPKATSTLFRNNEETDLGSRMLLTLSSATHGAGKAIAIGDYDGFVKVIADAETGEVVGTHMIGPDVTELVGEVGMLRLLEGTNVELGALTHAHPTLSEALKEAGLAVDGEAVHA